MNAILNEWADFLSIGPSGPVTTSNECYSAAGTAEQENASTSAAERKLESVTFVTPKEAPDSPLRVGLN
jgi:hypothetical protein